MKVGSAITEALQEQRHRDIDRIYRISTIERLWAGPLTRACGKGFHDVCGSWIYVALPMAPCLCECHQICERPAEMSAKQVLAQSGKVLRSLF